MYVVYSTVPYSNYVTPSTFPFISSCDTVRIACLPVQSIGHSSGCRYSIVTLLNLSPNLFPICCKYHCRQSSHYNYYYYSLSASSSSLIRDSMTAPYFFFFFFFFFFFGTSMIPHTVRDRCVIFVSVPKFRLLMMILLSTLITSLLTETLSTIAARRQ